MLQNVKHATVGKKVKNIKDLEEEDKRILDVHSKETAALIVNTIDKNIDKE